MPAVCSSYGVVADPSLFFGLCGVVALLEILQLSLVAAMVGVMVQDGERPVDLLG